MNEHSANRIPAGGREWHHPLLLLAVAVFALILTACAAKNNACVDKTLLAVATMTDARYRFGAPRSSSPLPDGTTAHEWLLDVSYEQPGRYVTEPSPWVRYDSDGYRIETERDVWKRPRSVSKYCRLVIVADASGRVLSSRYEGEDCCDLIIRPVTGG